MDEAYDLWRKEDWDKDQFFDHLNYVQRVAVALGNMNYQVNNGGWSQWYFNGYADTHVKFLDRMNFSGFPELEKAQEIMRDAYERLERNEENSRDGRYEDDESDVLDIYDKEYYKLKKAEKQMEEYICTLENNEA